MAETELPVLPDSVFLRILELLPLRDRLRAARVCRRWHRLALDRTVWRHVDLSPYRLTSRTLWHLLRRQLGDSVRTLRLRGRLRFGSKHRLLSPALLLALGKHCPHLQLLSLADTDLRPIPSATIPRSLTTLELSRCEIPTSWFCDSPPKPFPRLQHLIIHHVPAFSDRHLLEISSQSCLKTLSLCGTYRVTAAGIRSAAPRLGALERLVLRCHVGSDSAVGSVSRHMKRLRFLELSEADLTGTSLDSLTKLQLLESLCLQLCPRVPPGSVVALCRALPALRTLRFIGVRFEDEVVDQIRAILPRCSFSHAA